MHKTNTEARAFLDTFQNTSLPADREVVICAPFTALSALQKRLRGNTLAYGAQNMHWEEHGAYTGEISAPMLVELGCRYVIIGHSERRRDQHETDEAVQKKVRTALRFGLIPILCVGESLEMREQGKTEDVVRSQAKKALADLNTKELETIVIAYEPIWAIGTGEAATPEQAQEVQAMIRTIVTPKTRILYGGSVTPQNMPLLMTQPDIDGALVGGASLDSKQFLTIVSSF